MCLRSSLFRDVTQRGMVVTDNSVEPVGLILKGEGLKHELLGCLTFEYGTVGLFRDARNYR